LNSPTDRSNAAWNYPIFLDLQNVPVLVVGGGDVAARKVDDLIMSNAQVTIVSPQISENLTKCLRAGSKKHPRAKHIKRAYKSSDLRGHRLVFAATDNEALNERICQEVRRRGLLANCAAPPEAGNFSVPGTVKRGLLCLAISTGGTSAALAAHLRKALDEIFGDEWSSLTALLAKKRNEVRARITDPEIRRMLLTALGHPSWAGHIKKKGVKFVERQMAKLISSAARHQKPPL